MYRKWSAEEPERERCCSCCSWCLSGSSARHTRQRIYVCRWASKAGGMCMWNRLGHMLHRAGKSYRKIRTAPLRRYMNTFGFEMNY